MENKVWYLSKGTIGSLIIVIIGALKLLGVEISPDIIDQIPDQIIAAITLVAGILTFIGRLKANTVITWRK